ncbi:hypothetical protein EAG_02559 [Camponotus floridanus]|uniref:Uncharacterized protein n=1 Tax=Camponotus floridanus TaxID=104421 RepID=E1ZZR5_CAMFO|nr:hypothetical protein EAG_02559 [Camponotus floridanus]
MASFNLDEEGPVKPVGRGLSEATGVPGHIGNCCLHHRVASLPADKCRSLITLFMQYRETFGAGSRARTLRQARTTENLTCSCQKQVDVDADRLVPSIIELLRDEKSASRSFIPLDKIQDNTNWMSTHLNLIHHVFLGSKHPALVLPGCSKKNREHGQIRRSQLAPMFGKHLTIGGDWKKMFHDINEGSQLECARYAISLGSILTRNSHTLLVLDIEQGRSAVPARLADFSRDAQVVWHGYSFWEMIDSRIGGPIAHSIVDNRISVTHVPDTNHLVLASLVLLIRKFDHLVLASLVLLIRKFGLGNRVLREEFLREESCGLPNPRHSEQNAAAVTTSSSLRQESTADPFNLSFITEVIKTTAVASTDIHLMPHREGAGKTGCDPLITKATSRIMRGDGLKAFTRAKAFVGAKAIYISKTMFQCSTKRLVPYVHQMLLQRIPGNLYANDNPVSKITQ